MYMIAEVSQYVAVASFAEAWIEILLDGFRVRGFLVASFAEAWIEMVKRLCSSSLISSPPSRRRGLKLKNRKPKSKTNRSRLLRGGVD